MRARVGIYVRQSVREEQGIAQQIAECRNYVSARDWDVIDVYNDDNVSATKDRGAATAWGRLLADVDSGRVDTVVVVAPDRLGRRMVDVLEVVPPRRSVRVVVVRGGIDTADPAGVLNLSVLVLFAENEVRTKERRAIPYRAARRAEGHPWPGLVPFGYSWVPRLLRDARGTRYAINEHEAEVVRFLSREYLAQPREKLGPVVAEMNAKGWRTRAGVPGRRRPPGACCCRRFPRPCFHRRPRKASTTTRLGWICRHVPRGRGTRS